MKSTKFRNLKAHVTPEEVVKPSNHSSLFLFFSYVMGLVSLIFFVYGGGLLYQRWRPLEFSELHSEIQAKELKEEQLLPVTLKIDSIQLTLPIIKGEIKDGSWVLADNAASVISTKDASDSGWIVYGHNYPRILGALQHVTENDKVTLVLQNGKTVEYLVTDKEIVSPESIYSLTPGDFTDLIIYTCTGFLDSQRLIVKAQLKSKI